ncbi:MAG: hypothetical protein QOH08_1620 [Chloroflexota bacterium]|nr:hypothetical protein [Chloroflexota bacterium]
MFEKTARWLMTWVARNADATQREWADAMLAELEAIDGGAAQLMWALGGLRLLWRPYGEQAVRMLLCIAAVVVSNYTYTKFATARPITLFFYGQQLYLPLLGMLAYRATRRPWVAALTGITASLLGFVALHILGYGTTGAASQFATGSPGMYVQIVLCVAIGAAFGTAGSVVNAYGRHTAIAAS